MRIPEVKVRWTSKETGVSNVLQGVQQVSIRRGKDISHNTCDITLNNSQCSGRSYVDNGEIAFSTDDLIEVFVKFCDGTAIDMSAADDLIFSGRIVDFEVNLSDSKSPIKLKLSDSSYLALNKLWVGSETGKAHDLIVDQLIPHVNEGLLSEEQPIKADLESNSGFVQDTQTTEGTYPTVTLSKTFKPVYEAISELSSTVSTGEGITPYRFYIDKENNFRWFYPGETNAQHVMKVGDSSVQPSTNYKHPVTGVNQTATDTERHYIIGSKLKKAVYDVTNFIIYKAGEDMNNVQILYFYYDPTSGAPNTKDSLRVWEHIARAMKDEDFQAGNITRDTGDIYNYPTSYPMSPAWNPDVSVANDSEYNEEFQLEARRRAVKAAQTELSITGNPRYKGNIELIGANIYDPTEYIIFTSEFDGIKKGFFLIDEVSHVINKSGWTTTLKVTEDIAKELLETV